MQIEHIEIDIKPTSPGAITFRIEVRTASGGRFGAMETFPDDHFEPLFRRVVEHCVRRIERLVNDDRKDDSPQEPDANPRT